MAKSSAGKGGVGAGRSGGGARGATSAGGDSTAVAVDATTEVIAEQAPRVKLPRDPRRLNIDVAAAALAERGYKLVPASSQYDLASRTISYLVRQPNGKVARMMSDEVKSILYPKRARTVKD